MLSKNKTMPIIFSLACVAFFELSSGPISWLYIAEIMVDKSQSIATLSIALLNMCFATLPNLIIKMDPERAPAFIFFTMAAFTTIGTIILFVIMKETRGLSQAERMNLYNNEEEVKVNAVVSLDEKLDDESKVNK